MTLAIDILDVDVDELETDDPSLLLLLLPVLLDVVLVWECFDDDLDDDVIDLWSDEEIPESSNSVCIF